MQIGFLGGTGIEARGLALRLATAGASVALGSRTPERARNTARELKELFGPARLEGMDNRDMLSSCEMVLLTVPASEALNAVRTYGSLFKPHHVLIDVTVPLVMRAGYPECLEQEGLSNAEIIARALPADVPLVAAFKTIPAAILADPDSLLNCDDFVCGDSDEAKAKVLAVASLIPALRALDAGPLRAARTLERMAALAVALNRKYRKKGARFRLEGV